MDAIEAALQPGPGVYLTRATSTLSPATRSGDYPGQYFYAKTLEEHNSQREHGRAGATRPRHAPMILQQRSCTTMLSQPELLSRPAGNLETLKYAVLFGADAVYCALPEFGMRAAPRQLHRRRQLAEGCIFAHARGKKGLPDAEHPCPPTRSVDPPAPGPSGTRRNCGGGRLHRGGPGRGGAGASNTPPTRTSTFPPRRASPTTPRPPRPGTWGPSGWCWRGS